MGGCHQLNLSSGFADGGVRRFGLLFMSGFALFRQCAGLTELFATSEAILAKERCRASALICGTAWRYWG